MANKLRIAVDAGEGADALDVLPGGIAISFLLSVRSYYIDELADEIEAAADVAEFAYRKGIVALNIGIYFTYTVIPHPTSTRGLSPIMVKSRLVTTDVGKERTIT